MELKALSSSQERRLITYLDDQLLNLNRHFETRNSPRAVLPTIESYLDFLSSLESFILTIPPLGTSAPLRVAYLIHLTALLPDCFASYPLPTASLLPTFTFLETFDRAWLAVLNGSTWHAADSRAVPVPDLKGKGRALIPADTGVHGTDRVRLESIVRDVRETLRAVLGLKRETPTLVPLDQDRAILEPSYRIPTGEVAVSVEGGETRMSCAVEEMANVQEGATLDSEGATTPSLATDTTTDDEEMSEGDDDDEGDDDSDQFEEVQVVSPEASAVRDDDLPSFSISFQAPPSLPIESSGDDEVEPEQRKGFDPDAEYGMDDDDEDGPTVAPEEDETDEELQDQVNAVFEGSMARLEELKLLRG